MKFKFFDFYFSNMKPSNQNMSMALLFLYSTVSS